MARVSKPKPMKRYTKDDPPADVVVFLHFVNPPKDGPTRMRVGQYHDLEAARTAIKDNEVARRQSFGGLIEPAATVTGPVEYTIWVARGWDRVA